MQNFTFIRPSVLQGNATSCRLVNVTPNGRDKQTGRARLSPPMTSGIISALTPSQRPLQRPRSWAFFFKRSVLVAADMQHFQRLKVAFITTLGFTFYANRKFYKTLISPMTVVPGSHALPRLDIATYWQNIFCYLSTSFFFFLFWRLAFLLNP